MKDLRAEIRSAYEKEQAENPPAADLRQAVASAVARQPRRQPGSQWIAVVAAALLAVLVVAGLMSTRLANRGSVPAKPHATPIADYGPPPPGVHLIYLADPRHPGRYDAIDWTGRYRGAIKLATPLDSHVYLVQAPDGSQFMTSELKATPSQFFDRLGATITDPNAASGQRTIWADDSRHLCTLGGFREWDIGLRTPGMPPTSLHRVALDSTNLTSGIIAITVAACSPANDRAVLQYSFERRPTEFWVVRISDGTILGHAAYPAGQVSDVVASLDAGLVAVNSGASAGQIGPAAAATRILRSSDQSVAARLDPSMGVLALNGDDSMALVYTTPWAAGVPTSLALVDLSSGSVTWRYSGGAELAGFFIEPGGRDFAVMLESTSDQGPGAAISLLIVHANGTTTAVRGSFLHP